MELPLDYLVQFIHLDKQMRDFASDGPGFLEARHRMFEASAEEWEALERQFEINASRAAEDLAKDPDVKAAVDAFPLSGRVVFAGDSLIDDLQSWVEILRRLLAAERPDLELEVVNAGVSKATSENLMELSAQLPFLEPDWVVFLIGTNDASGYRAWEDQWVSDEEFSRNIGLIDSAARAAGARVLWVTPPPVDDEVIAADEMNQAVGYYIRTEDVAGKAAAIRALDSGAVDLWPAFEAAADPDNFGPDGVHPSLEGHKLIVATVLEHLAARAG